MAFIKQAAGSQSYVDNLRGGVNTYISKKTGKEVTNFRITTQGWMTPAVGDTSSFIKSTFSITDMEQAIAAAREAGMSEVEFTVFAKKSVNTATPKQP